MYKGALKLHSTNVELLKLLGNLLTEIMFEPEAGNTYQMQASNILKYEGVSQSRNMSPFSNDVATIIV